MLYGISYVSYTFNKLIKIHVYLVTMLLLLYVLYLRYRQRYSLSAVQCIHVPAVTAFLISLLVYDTSLASRASYLALHSSLFWPVNYDYIITNSINSLLVGSRCIPNGTH